MPRYFGTLKNKEIITGRELLDGEYEHLVNISDQLRLFSNCQTLYKIFLFNFSDFMKYLISVDVPPLAMSARTSQFDEITFNINRYLNNMLSSFKAYDDHVPSQLNRRFGDNSSQLDSFKKEKSRIYDSFFEYRFLYKLRNYTQHREFPKYHIEYKADITSPESSKGSYQFLLDAPTLLNNYDSWGTCKQDLVDRTTLINIKEEANKLATQMTNLDIYVSNFYVNDLNNAIQYFKDKFQASDFLNVEYCIIEGIGNEGETHSITTKNLSTDVISTQLRKVKAYEQIKKNEG
tara:strand:+ start:783 stop:1655 length:873 start_codon:yes stop_codon:yes gene_type:complete